MRLEYIAVGFILMLVVVMVVLSILSGVAPGVEFIFSKVK